MSVLRPFIYRHFANVKISKLREEYTHAISNETSKTVIVGNGLVS